MRQRHRRKSTGQREIIKGEEWVSPASPHFTPQLYWHNYSGAVMPKVSWGLISVITWEPVSVISVWRTGAHITKNKQTHARAHSHTPRPFAMAIKTLKTIRVAPLSQLRRCDGGCVSSVNIDHRVNNIKGNSDSIWWRGGLRPLCGIDKASYDTLRGLTGFGAQWPLLGDSLSGAEGIGWQLVPNAGWIQGSTHRYKWLRKRSLVYCSTSFLWTLHII